MFAKFNVICTLCIGLATAEFTTSSVSGALNSLPPEFQGKIDEAQVKEISNKTAELFKEKCETNGGPNAYAEAEKAYKALPECLTSLVDTKTLNDEIEAAKQNGTVDEIFKKYCDKKSEFKQCFRVLADASEQCFSAEERDNIKIIHNVTEQLAEFVCYKDGDRIALFIAEHGPECLQSNQNEIQACVNDTVGTVYQFNGNFTIDSIPKISFQVKECNMLTELQTCVVKVLEKCSAPTTANIADSLFKFVRQATPCKVPETKGAANTESRTTSANVPGSAGGLTVTSATLAAALFTLLLQ